MVLLRTDRDRQIDRQTDIGDIIRPSIEQELKKKDKQIFR